MTIQRDEPLRLGVLGAGMIATTHYGVVPNLEWIRDKVYLVAIADPVLDRAQQAAKEFAIPEVYDGLDAMLQRSDIDAVANLTPITAHGATSTKILEAGKHLVTEKPLATTMAEADAIIEMAEARDLSIVSSPPNMVQPVYTEARRMLETNTIGQVAFARVRSSHAGPGGAAHGWPTDPTWFYQEGSGPLLDMGVYGIHEITGLLGPAQRVVAFSGITEPTRVVRGAGPYAGKVIDVTADDNNLFMLDFGHSTFAVIDGTFNVHASKSPKIEIFGRNGVLNVYDRGAQPPLEVYRTDALPGLDGWIEPRGWPHLRARQEWQDKLGRAILIDHLADSLQSAEQPVLSADHARHALEIMLKVTESARSGQTLDLTTSF